MSELLNGLIYKIVSIWEIERDDIYIGSTVRLLDDEFQEHVANYNRPIKKVMYGTERLFTPFLI